MIREASPKSVKLELRLSNGHSRPDDEMFERSNSLARNVSSKQEESSTSSIRHSRHQSTVTSSTSTSTSNSASRRRKAAASTSVTSEAASSVLHHSSSSSRHEQQLSSPGVASTHRLSTSSSTSSRRVETSTASLVLSNSPGVHQDSISSGFLYPEILLSSPDVRSLVKEIGCDFAELENALCSTTRPMGHSITAGGDHGPQQRASLSTRLFGHHRRPLSPISYYQSSVKSIEPQKDVDESPAQEQTWRSSSRQVSPASSTWSLKRESRDLSERSSGDRIRELMNKAQSQTLSWSPQQQTSLDTNANGSRKLTTASFTIGRRQHLSPTGSHSESSACSRRSSAERSPSGGQATKQQVEQAAAGDADAALPKTANNLPVTESIERIDQRMSGICKKLNDCRDTKEAIDLLKIMIQMIEKAWSVPVCGDDLGFKLCNSLREAGGFDIILGFIQESDFIIGEADERPKQQEPVQLPQEPNSKPATSRSSLGSQSSIQAKNNGSSNPLRLNLSKVEQLAQTPTGDSNSPPSATRGLQHSPALKNIVATKDSDSEIFTSDLGLDSTSVESLSYASAASPPTSGPNTAPAEEVVAEDDQAGEQKLEAKEEREDDQMTGDLSADERARSEKEEACLRKEELVFLSARLLSQCLTSENRDYIVADGLDPVIKLACNFTTMKSTQSKRLLSRSVIMRQSSTISNKTTPKANQQSVDEISSPGQHDGRAVATSSETNGRQVGENNKLPAAANIVQQPKLCAEHSDTHAIIGTEILQHLFKHSECTCSRIISLGGLEAILYGCRSSQIETLRHCASALANLALYGGPDSQQTMIEQKAHVWLFPLAFNEDDNIQYYACLAIVVLVANQEIEADVLKSSTLDLVEPFVLGHEPQKFAESTTAHIHGQSAQWLRKLIPLLESKREEARNLACFHFAMEAHIKREQGRTGLFAEIGAIEPLRKVGSSPLAIASKFACQALRLIGEKEPHKLRQQVPLWTSDDVVEWVSQIGFERYKPVFVESRVDGDLLLQLDEEMLKTDLQIDNGIIRRRFLRELSNLKRIADYSPVDKSGLSASFSSGSSCSSASNHDFVRQYIYPLLQLGVTRDNIHLFDCEQLLTECKVTNPVHRLKLAQAIKGLQERLASGVASVDGGSVSDADQKTLDVFVSYRRATGSQLASLLKVHLQLRGFTVFIDVERLEAGKFDNNLLDSIRASRNFILVLSPNALDRCIGDQEGKDWVHKEIVAALASDCNIIPIIDNFHWPDVDQLPEDMRSVAHFNGVRWYHDYQDACVDKVERFIRGELLNNWATVSSASSTAGCGAPGNQSSGGGSLQRLPNVGSVSTPSIVATPSISSAIGSSSMRPPFDADHHPLSSPFASAYHLQHSQNLFPIRR